MPARATGGIGETSAWLGRDVCKGLQFLAVRLDEHRNAASRPNADIVIPNSAVRVLVVHAPEDLMLTRESRRLALEPC